MDRETKNKLKKFENNLMDIRRSLKEQIQQARKEGNSQTEIDNITGSALSEEGYYKEQIRGIITQEILGQAFQLNISLPEMNIGGIWETDYTNEKILTDKEMLLVKQRIIAEKRERSKLHLLYISTIGGIGIGIIGALMGLIAVLSK